MQETTVQRRIAARDQARIVAGLVVEEAGRIAPDAQAAFWDELRKMVPFPQNKEAKKTAAASTEPMTARQAAAFGRSRMPFGEFKGARIDDVALDRLQWYADATPFQHNLRRYLAAPRIRSEEEQNAS